MENFEKQIMIHDIYKEKGYENRDEYLVFLADEYEVDIRIVYMLAEELGETEDFDGLVNTLEDMQAFWR